MNIWAAGSNVHITSVGMQSFYRERPDILRVIHIHIFICGRTHISRKLGDKHLQARQKKQLEKLHSKVVTAAGELGLSLTDPKSLPAVRRRSKGVVARTFHKFGIVVPYDEETELGYRPLPMTDST